MNVARIAALRAGFPDQVSAMTINRFCSSGLQSIALASANIRAGMNEVVMAGGTESMSLIPMEGNKFSPNPVLVDEDPDVYLSMGLTAENLAGEPRGATALYAVASGDLLTLRALADAVEVATGQELKAGWGAIPYRAGMPMRPGGMAPPPPGWQPQVALADGLRKLAMQHRQAAS